jgi:molybdenum cofactor biosynthesis protein MoaC
MSGVPSITVGIFVYALVVLQAKHFSAFAGGVALGVLMLPTVTRTTEELLRLVPESLREAALGLGVPTWRATLSVMLRTAAPGIATGVMLAVARVAGIQAAKRAPDLIPLCHPLLVGSVFVNFRIEDRYIEVEAQVETVDRTGVEMEALTAATVAALTIYDMCKSSDRSMVIGEIALWEKTGGRSGVYRRDPLEPLGADALSGDFDGSLVSALDADLDADTDADLVGDLGADLDDDEGDLDA